MAETPVRASPALLSGTPGAAYGPVLYVAHLPFQKLLSPDRLNLPSFNRAALDAGLPYYLPPDLATRLVTVSFHLLGVVALVVAGRRLAGREAAWGLAALYCGSAYVMGVGGEGELIGGMTFISHVAPVALTLAAFAVLSRPWLSGALLVTAVATLFYPVFFFPAWFGYYWSSRPAALRFLGGCIVAAVLIGVPTLLMSRAVEGRGLIGTLLYETQGHQEIKEGYGSSPFGFWGQREGWRALLREPLVEDQPNTSPLVLAFLGFVVAAFFLARGRGEVQLALLTGAVAVAVQIWKIHGTGVYVSWYYPFLLLGFFGSPGAMTRSVAPGDTPRQGRESGTGPHAVRGES